MKKNKKINKDTKWGDIVKELSFLDQPQSSPKYAEMKTMFAQSINKKKKV